MVMYVFFSYFGFGVRKNIWFFNIFDSFYLLNVFSMLICLLIQVGLVIGGCIGVVFGEQMDG